MFLEADRNRDGRYESMAGDTVRPGAPLRVRVTAAPGSYVRIVTDGPAFIVICFGCVPAITLALGIQIAFSPPFWVHLLTSLPFALITSIAPLRPLKGWFIASQYLNKAREGRLVRRVIIVGGGPAAEALIEALNSEADSDLRICGLFDDRGDSRLPPQPRVKGHHGALTEPDQGQRPALQTLRRELAIEERIEVRPSGLDPAPTLARIAERQAEPLPAKGRTGTGLRGVRRAS